MYMILRFIFFVLNKIFSFILSFIYVRLRLLILFIFSLCLLLPKQQLSAQSSIDTAAINKRVQNEYLKRDSIIAAAKEKRIQDSISRELQKIKLQQFRDSLQSARIAKRTKDSLERVEAKLKIIREQAIRDSIATATKKRYQDSIAIVQKYQDSIRAYERKKQDSTARALAQIRDSIDLARKRISDSINTARKAELKRKAEYSKYINSKAYKDSVELRMKFVKDSTDKSRQKEKDAVLMERDRISDSIRSARARINDSMSNARKAYNDSVSNAIKANVEKIKEERNRIKDSIAASRKQRTDSLSALREKNEKPLAGKSKEEQQRAAAMAMHKKKQAEWSNDKLLAKKWSLHRRIFQNTVTRYNYYYNARKKYNEAIRNMIRTNKEDYDNGISIKPYNLEKQGSSVGNFMDSVIKKTSFGTQIHDPRSKWFDNMYFLMGKASYTKGDIDGAILTFQFVANEYKDNPYGKKKKINHAKSAKEDQIATIENRKGTNLLRHHPVRNDALLWLAKSYVRAEQYNEAASLMALLEKDKHYPSRLKPELYYAQTNLALTLNDNKQAIEALSKALKNKMSDKQRGRNEFLLGQLYAKEGELKNSSEHFKKSLHKKADPEMEFFAKLYIAQNASNGAGDERYAIQQLNSIINDPKYAKYKSQALNSLAKLEEKNNPANALEILKKSIQNPENKDNKQKAIAFAQMGDIYYTQSSYQSAKISYDSAAYYGNNPPIDNINEVMRRKNVLADVVAYIKVITTQDSLIALSLKSDKEKRAIAKKELERLQKEKKDLENAKAAQPVALQPNNPSPQKNNWYFYNASIMQKGSTEFKTKWGNRPNEDNWRRSAALALSLSGTNKNTDSGDEDNDNIDGMNINQLLDKLPKTPAELDAAHGKIMDAWFNLGLTYYSRLDDYPNAIKSYDTILKKYPQTEFKKQVYYGLYLTYQKMGNTAKESYYKNLLNTEYAGTEYARLANNIKEEQKSVLLASTTAYYDETYQLYKNGQYIEALSRVSQARQQLKAHPLLPKYDLVEAVAHAGLKNYKNSIQTLEKVISNYPNTPEQLKAQELLAYLSKETNIKGDSAAKGNNAFSAPGEPSLGITNSGNKYQDSLEASEAFKQLRDADGKGIYIADPDAEHKLIIFIKNVDGRTMGLKSAISDYNMLKHMQKEYVSNLNLLTAQQGLVSVDKFSNSVFARQYRIEMEKEKILFSQFKSNEYDIAIITKANYAELIKTRDILGYMRFYKKNYK